MKQRGFLLLTTVSLFFCIIQNVSGQGNDALDLELINEFIESGKQSESNPEPNPPMEVKEQAKTGNGASVAPLPLSKGEGKPSSNEENSQEFVREPKSCECVKYYLCNIDNGTVVDNGDVVGLIDIRLGASRPSQCPHYFDICCPDLKEPIDTSLSSTTKKFEHSVCGKRNVGGVGFRITGADNMEAQFGEFPWMAAIVRQEHHPDKPTLNIYQCGGSLIHPQVILTAAHCVHGKQPEELKVRLGEWDTQTLHELYAHQDRYVHRIVIHEGYYSGALFNDIALLYLTEPAQFSPNVDTVCLPPAHINFDGQTCFASGWGKNTFGQDGKYQVILKKVELPVVPVDKCQGALRRTRLGPHFKLHNSFVCAGGEAEKDTCKGDGGSPLVCQLPDSPYYVQLGIVAWGIGCGDQGTPGVYVNVPMFVPWITEQLRKAKMDTSFFKVSS